MTRIFVICLLLFSITNLSTAQKLQPGFEKEEFIELLKIGARTSKDSSYYKKLPAPQQSKLVYQSPLVGFDNFWQLWMRNDSVAIISIRGTTKTLLSFLANMYAVMVPASGSIELEKDFPFNYKLSTNPKAAVHVGFLMATAYLSRDILPQIDSCYKTGTREFIISGHSQGGAITYTMTSYLEQLKKEGRLPMDIRFKTCAVAAPKPGNLYYAYEFEALTKNGWSYNVVSTVDWVPEMPFSIQTVNDINKINPFVNAKSMIKKRKFPVDLVLLHAYNKLSKPAKKAQRNYEKWLGNRMQKLVKKNLTSFTPPSYYSSNNYVRTGNTVLLVPDSLYYIMFPENKDSIWRNHTQVPYLFLAEKLPANSDEHTQMEKTSMLNGNWQLCYIADQSLSMDSLFLNSKPELNINTATNQLSGNSGCNRFNGALLVSGSKINFNTPLAITRMACPGNGEYIFLETLKTITSFSVSYGSLTLIADDIAVMHFKRM